MNKIMAATTFSHSGFELYGKRCIESFIEHWPSNVTLVVFHEGMRDNYPESPRVKYRLLDNPDLQQFKSRNRKNQEAHGLGTKALVNKANFSFDAVRFSHKVFAYYDLAVDEEADIAIWLDGDTFTHTPIPADQPEKWLNNRMAGFLDRPWLYTETGFHIFDMRYDEALRFFRIWTDYYKHDTVFELEAWTDCHTYDATRRQFPANLFHSLSPEIKHPHPFINGELGKYMDHMKGPRKQLGSSKPTDLVVSHNENYWKNLKQT